MIRAEPIKARPKKRARWICGPSTIVGSCDPIEPTKELPKKRAHIETPAETEARDKAQRDRELQVLHDEWAVRKQRAPATTFTPFEGELKDGMAVTGRVGDEDFTSDNPGTLVVAHPKKRAPYRGGTSVEATKPWLTVDPPMSRRTWYRHEAKRKAKSGSAAEAC